VDLFRTVACFLLASILCGCAASNSALYRRLQSEDPDQRIRAAVRAAKSDDEKAVPYLVDRLEDSEEEVRFAAYMALKQITGKTMGWRYYEPPERRAEAVRRWRQWLTETRGKEPAESSGQQ